MEERFMFGISLFLFCSINSVVRMLELVGAGCFGTFKSLSLATKRPLIHSGYRTRPQTRSLSFRQQIGMRL